MGAMGGCRARDSRGEAAPRLPAARGRLGLATVAAIMVITGVGPMPAVAEDLHAMTMVMWNPHWQCFVWDQHNCSRRMESALELVLEAADADFAAVVELEDDSYVPPTGWLQARSICGHDMVTLMHNHRRWEPLTDAAAGCMIPNNRPYVVQKFKLLSPFEVHVVIAAAHFPHPYIHENRYGDLNIYRQGAKLDVLRDAIQKFVGHGGSEKVALIADTNAYDWVPSTEIMHLLNVPPNPGRPPFLSTTLEQSCCFDSNFEHWGTFDRVVANFGQSMKTSMPYRDTLPIWAQQVEDNGTRKGAFHKPVVGTVLFAAEPQVYLRYISLVAFGAVVGTVATMFFKTICCPGIRNRSGKHVCSGQALSESESSPSE